MVAGTGYMVDCPYDARHRIQWFRGTPTVAGKYQSIVHGVGGYLSVQVSQFRPGWDDLLQGLGFRVQG